MTHASTAPVDVDRFVGEHAGKSLPELLSISATLLAEDVELGPLATNVNVYDYQLITVGVSGGSSALASMSRCAQARGAVITAEPYTCEDGQTKTYCKVRFPYQGVQVEAYVFASRAA